MRDLTINWDYSQCPKFERPLAGAPLVKYRYNVDLTTSKGSKILDSQEFKYGPGDVDRFLVDLNYPDFGVYTIWLSFKYERLGQKSGLIYSYEEALRICRDAYNPWGESAYLANLSLCYHSLGQTERAIELSEDALRIIRMIGDRGNEGSVLGHLGIYYRGLGQVEVAQDYHERSLRIAHDLGIRHLVEGESHNLASCYFDTGLINEAIELYEQALDINKAETLDRGWEANHYVGKSDESVGPTTDAFPAMSSAISNPKSSTSPPR